MGHNICLLICLISMAVAIQVSYACNYEVINDALNTTGGSRFSTEIGEKYIKKKMDCSTKFIWKLFKEKKSSDRKQVEKVDVIIDNDVEGVASICNNQIKLSSSYIEDYSGNVKEEITGVLYHEMTRIWQWDGEGKTNQGLLTGVADYVRLKAEYAPSHWVAPGEGDRWDQGYDVTARFLDYCSTLSDCFVAELNKKMKEDYDDSFFCDLLGKSVDELWKEYKEHYQWQSQAPMPAATAEFLFSELFRIVPSEPESDELQTLC